MGFSKIVPDSSFYATMNADGNVVQADRQSAFRRSSRSVVDYKRPSRVRDGLNICFSVIPSIFALGVVSWFVHSRHELFGQYAHSPRGDMTLSVVAFIAVPMFILAGMSVYACVLPALRDAKANRPKPAIMRDHQSSVITPKK